MIEQATVYFTNGESTAADRVKILDSGWVGIHATDGWVYYPERQIGRVVSRDNV